MFTPANSPSLRLHYGMCDQSPAAEVAGSLSHVNTKNSKLSKILWKGQTYRQLRATESAFGWGGGDFHTVAAAAAVRDV